MRYMIFLSVLLTGFWAGLASAANSEDFAMVAAPIIERAQELARYRALKPRASIPIVAIAGCSAVGKTYFSKELYRVLRRMGLKVALIFLDDFIDKEMKTCCMHENFDHEGLHALLQNISIGKENTYIMSRDLILLEGSYVLCDTAPYNFSQYSTLRIFIDAAEDDIRRWKRERAAARSGPARPKKIFEKRLEWNMKDYRINIKPSSKNAHFLILKDGRHNYTVTSVAPTYSEYTHQ